MAAVLTAVIVAGIVSLWWLANLWFKERAIAIFVVFLAALPPLLVTTYTTATLGGYGESLVLGNLILGLGYLVTYGGKEENRWLWLVSGKQPAATEAIELPDLQPHSKTVSCFPWSRYGVGLSV